MRHAFEIILASGVAFIDILAGSGGLGARGSRCALRMCSLTGSGACSPAPGLAPKKMNGTELRKTNCISDQLRLGRAFGRAAGAREAPCAAI
jgi:hypothetical protein